jgi:hypothetical protein
MRTRSKRVPAFFQVYENDSLKEYLEDMALKGWQLKEVGSLFLRFEPCRPHKIRYCVEVMDKPSAFASSQSENLKAYQEFCRDAGWDYVGTTGYLHIFCTEDEKAVVVETDPQERYERICQACQGNNWLACAVFGLITLLNLYSCYLKKTLFCINGWVLFIMIGAMAVSLGEFLRWKSRAGRSLREEGVLPCYSWKAVKRKNVMVIAPILLMSMAPMVYTAGRYSSKIVIGVTVGMCVYVILLAFFFSKLLYWLRVKKAYSTKTNMFIYWGIGLVISMAACSGMLAVIFWIL